MAQEREQKILRALERTEYTPARVLAEELGVSVRTVQNLIREINRDNMSYGARITMKKHYGYRLEVWDEKLLERFVSQAPEGRTQKLPDTPQKRVSYIALLLLESDEYLKLEELCDRLCISRSTIAADMKDVRELFARFDIQVESKPNYGMKVRCTELERRRCLAWLFKQDDELTHLTLFESGLYVPISNIVEKTIAEENFQLSDIYKKNLILHLCIAITQIERGLLLTGQGQKLSGYDEENGHLAHVLADQIRTELGVNLEESEIGYIAMQLSCKQIIRHETTKKNVVLDQQVQDLADEMLLRVYEEFAIDLRDDFELRMNLCLHLVPLRSRLRYGFPAENPLLSDIRQEYPLAYELAAAASHVVSEQFWAQVNEDEIGFLAILFALALERRRSQVRLNVLLVCGSGSGSVGLLKLQLQREFKNTIGEIRVCNVKQLEQMDFQDIDFIFTTVSIEKIVPVPIVEVSWFLGTEEVRQIRRTFEKRERIAFRKYFYPELFYAEIPAKSKEEVLWFLCQEAVWKGFSQPGLYELVMAREALGKTTYQNGIAMPHPTRSLSRETFIEVCILKEAVDWDGTMVRLVFLISVSMTKSHDLNDFYKGITRLFTDKKLTDRLLAQPQFEVLAEIIRTLEE